MYQLFYDYEILIIITIQNNSYTKNGHKTIDNDNKT